MFRPVKDYLEITLLISMTIMMWAAIITLIKYIIS